MHARVGVRVRVDVRVRVRVGFRVRVRVRVRVMVRLEPVVGLGLGSRSQGLDVLQGSIRGCNVSGHNCTCRIGLECRIWCRI